MRLVISIIALMATSAILMQGAKSNATSYIATDLVSDQPGVALVLDPALINGWGIALNSTGGAFWVSSEGGGVAELYTGDHNGGPLSKAALSVTIPGGHPTGTVFNSTSEFEVSSATTSHSALFIFASTTGLVTGWSPQVSMTEAKVAFTGTDAIYTGIALANNGSGNFLYLADFHNRKIEVLNGLFQPAPTAGSFTDPNLPGDYAPFNIATLNGKLYVAYAEQDSSGHDEIIGAHLGFIDVFDTDGNFLQRLVSQGKLNAPWAMVLAPTTFGDFSSDLLVGNFGDGRINAFDPISGAFLGTLGASDKPIAIDGLWGLAFGNGSTAGDTTTLYYAAGPDDEMHGLFGKITANPSGTVAVRATLANGTLSITGGRDDDNVDVQLNSKDQLIIVLADDKPLGAFDLASVDRIEFRGFDGDDRIRVANGIVVPTMLFGGAGNDDLTGGGGNNILVGGPGDDDLRGSDGRDILIGGDGEDTVRGGSNEDLLIGGSTSYDNDTTALIQILQGWSSIDSYANRIDQLRHGSNGLPKLDSTTVLDDGAKDSLDGDQGLDWFFAGSADVLDRTASEQVN